MSVDLNTDTGELYDMVNGPDEMNEFVRRPQVPSDPQATSGYGAFPRKR
jgi:hypothetical protein